MDGEILDVVTEWGTRPVADGVSGLYELADGEFSGAVTDGTAWAFVLNGRFVGVFDGTIEDFEDASLTAYTAPDMALPLLYAMQARGGEVRGRYYSNDTPLSEIDGTLSSGNFVGYVELSENVLSGDYYVVYYGGRALPVAYVGNNRRLLSGDEAFERAADEVGIYAVVDADIEVVDLPERPAGMGAVASESETADAGDTDDTASPAAGVGADASTATDTDDGAAGADTAAANDGEAPPSTTTTEDEFRSLGELSGVDDAPTTDAEASTTGADAESSETPSESAETEAASSTADTEATPDAEGDEVDAPTDDVVIGDATADESSTDADATATPEELDRLRSELDALRAAKAEIASERDRIASERDDLRAEVDRLRDRVASLEAEIERLEREADGADDAGAAPAQELSPAEALSKTNLFVRYEDKAAGTLERAAEGRISPAELRDNLRLNYHTEFETGGVTVDGQPFEPFLRGTPEHRFAEWLLTTVTHEIRRTDTRAELSKLYEAIESVDRIDLDGEVDVAVEDAEGEVETTTMAFDVVFRDKMGDPLFAAAFDDSRDPTRAETIRSLLDGARSVSRAVESFAAAFVVTTSFFDADAMEVAIDATRGGLFSRSSRKSYVKLSRKSGFHLCLVEARDEDFFLSVPEL
ncbi:DUF7527 domain-containing protein [Haloplanus natans]|uniref:DUF7527 domain-containing protein n=1 Tax=Haloplanus natans TaxID=376171 RepID=UPI000678098E|nr:hypothetical protein [Haloplanus natans]